MPAQCFTSSLLEAKFRFPEMSFTFPAGMVTDTSLCDNDKTVKEYRALESSLNLHKHKQKP